MFNGAAVQHCEILQYLSMHFGSGFKSHREQVEVMMQARHVQQRLDGGSDIHSPAAHSPSLPHSPPSAAAGAPGKENLDSQDEGGELLAAFERASQEIERASQDMPTDHESSPSDPSQACHAPEQREQGSRENGSQGCSQGDFMRGVLQDCIGPSTSQQQQHPNHQHQRDLAGGLAAPIQAVAQVPLSGSQRVHPKGMLAAADTAVAALHTPCSPLAHPRTTLLRGPEGGNSGRSTATTALHEHALGLEQDSLGGDEVATPGRHGSWIGTQIGVFDGSMSADDSPGLLSMHGAAAPCSEPAQAMAHSSAKPDPGASCPGNDSRELNSAVQVIYLHQRAFS